jgi:tetratricopeptide (TPR) repeat protein/O-antigen ligase
MLRGAVEAVVLLLVVLSPWAYGSIHPLSRLGLYAGLAVVLALWAARLLVERRVAWQWCPATLCLSGLLLLGAWQLAPLPRPLLAWLSPATVELRDRLVPQALEVFPEGDQAAAPDPTLSLYPGGTRAMLLELLALLALFAAVRNNCASRGSLWRLAAAAAANGALLSLFALVQFFSSPHNVVYWTYPTQGSVYGPFICRTHFPAYTNVCLGLGFGLLLATLCGRAGRRRADALEQLTRRPAALWVGFSLALMLAATAYSMSRGGVLSVAGASLVCLPVLLLGSRRGVGVAAAAGVGLVGLALVGWFGLGAVENRMATLWEGDALETSRLPLWKRTAPQAARFPVWGAGYGTFQVLEATCHTPANHSLKTNEHAHNEYLEALIEGGACRLAVVLALLAAVYRLGWRAYRQDRAGPTGALVLGGLFALTTLVIHSAGDFGIHYPAIALLGAVLAAQLCGLGAGPASWRAGGLVALGCAALALLVGGVLVLEGYRAEQAERLRLASILRTRRGAPGDKEQATAYLRAAVALRPDDVGLRFLLAESLHEEYWAGRRRAEEGQALAAAARALLAACPPGPGAPPQPALVALAAADRVQARAADGRARELERGRLVPALRRYLEARALCPLLPEPHVRLASHAKLLRRTDDPRAYIDRACQLIPAHPEVWYARGTFELAQGRRDLAWDCWRRSLECSPAHLADILSATASELAPAEVADRLLPPDVSLLLEAAQHPAHAGRPAAVRVFRERALRLLESPPAPLGADLLHHKAEIYRDLGQPDEAIAAYRAALALAPAQASWRFDMARLLYEQGRLPDARRELRAVRAQQPGHQEAGELLRAVLREQARR